MRIREVRNERGASIVIVAVSLFAMLGMAALAVDMGMLLKVRSDAQRVADAAALAGAIEYKRGKSPTIRDLAADSALTYAARNYVGWQSVNTTVPIKSLAPDRRIINSPEAYIESIPDSYKVRVWIRRSGTATWFGNLLGLDWVPIGARAAAHVANAGTAKCVKPFAIPDLWNETSNVCGNRPQDCNRNKVWDTGEGWNYEPPSDTYGQYDPDGADSLSQTGYGSAWRNDPVNSPGVINDHGRLITIKAQRPGEAITSGFFYPWRMPMADGDTASGANDYRALLTDTTCTLAAPTLVDTTYRVENGNMVGPTRQAIQDLISYDPTAHWDPNVDDGEGHMGSVVTTKYENWRDSPRVIVLGIMNPSYIANIQSGGNLHFEFNNLALFFIEGFAGPPQYTGPASQAPIKGRFLYFVEGYGPTGPVAGSLIKKLELIE